MISGRIRNNPGRLEPSEPPPPTPLPQGEGDSKEAMCECRGPVRAALDGHAPAGLAMTDQDFGSRWCYIAERRASIASQRVASIFTPSRRLISWMPVGEVTLISVR
jgi:hypothetical protein